MDRYDGLGDMIWIRRGPKFFLGIAFADICVDKHMRNMYPHRPKLSSHNLGKGALAKLADRQIQMPFTANDRRGRTDQDY